MLEPLRMITTQAALELLPAWATDAWNVRTKSRSMAGAFQHAWARPNAAVDISMVRLPVVVERTADQAETK